MTVYRGTRLLFWRSAVAGACILSASGNGLGDSVIMKSGLVYRGQGAPDRDNTLVYISDGVKRVVVRDSKIERIDANNAFRTGERFHLDQPITVLGGIMPKEVVSVEAGPWNERGRRAFRYVGSRLNQPKEMEQAIIEIGPHTVQFRGVDGFWKGLLETNQIPRNVVTSLLGRVEQNNVEERERVVRFLMDMGWHNEAKEALARLATDFPQPELKERVANAQLFILQAQAMERRSAINVCRDAQQYHRMATLFKSFQEKGVPTELQIEVREIERIQDQQNAADLTLDRDLRKLEDRLPGPQRIFWKEPLAEVHKAIDEAPDAVRDRFAAWRKAASAPRVSAEAQFALAMSGYVAGHTLAMPELKGAATLWKARDLVRAYLVGIEPAARREQMAKLNGLEWADVGSSTDTVRRLEILTRIVQLMPPPGHVNGLRIEETMKHRVVEDENNVPTEYAVRLPPEYHPLRSYPAVIVLHYAGQSPAAAIDDWAAEAARRGYILIAPEYNLPDQTPDYHYSPNEHAAAELSLRDARKRYSIDSDRVFAAGQLAGANMAWDLALSHPDLFAGVVVISGLPFKYVPRYLGHHDRMPLFFVIGDLAPAASEFVYGSYIKSLILKTWDITYAEYYRRGLETLPEEIPRAFEWMDRHRRDPYPKSFKINTARTCDDRFYGVVVREFGAGRVTAPQAVEELGQNLNPATIEMKSSTLANLVQFTVEGVTELDIWLSPKLIDFKRKPDVRINGNQFNRQFKVKLELEPMLDDVRVRGDRQQIYWYRIIAR